MLKVTPCAGRDSEHLENVNDINAASGILAAKKMCSPRSVFLQVRSLAVAFTFGFAFAVALVCAFVSLSLVLSPSLSLSVSLSLTCAAAFAFEAIENLTCNWPTTGQ